MVKWPTIAFFEKIIDWYVFLRGWLGWYKISLVRYVERKSGMDSGEWLVSRCEKRVGVGKDPAMLCTLADAMSDIVFY